MNKEWQRDLDPTWWKVAPSSWIPSRNHSSSGAGWASPRLRQVRFPGTPAIRDTEGPPSTWGASGGTAWQNWGQNCILEAESLILSAPPTSPPRALRLHYSGAVLTAPFPTLSSQSTDGLGPHPSHAVGQVVIGGPLVKPDTHMMLRLLVPQV